MNATASHPASDAMRNGLRLIESDAATISQLRRAADAMLRHAIDVGRAVESEAGGNLDGRQMLNAPMAMLAGNLTKVSRMLNELADLRERIRDASAIVKKIEANRFAVAS